MRRRKVDREWKRQKRAAINTRGAYRVTNQQSLACLSGSERRRPSWFLDMKYQTCYHSGGILYSKLPTQQDCSHGNSLTETNLHNNSGL